MKISQSCFALALMPALLGMYLTTRTPILYVGRAQGKVFEPKKRPALPETVQLLEIRVKDNSGLVDLSNL
jgi:hypothetical protein